MSGKCHFINRINMNSYSITLFNFIFFLNLSLWWPEWASHPWLIVVNKMVHGVDQKSKPAREAGDWWGKHRLSRIDWSCVCAKCIIYDDHITYDRPGLGLGLVGFSYDDIYRVWTKTVMFYDHYWIIMLFCCLWACNKMKHI